MDNFEQDGGDWTFFSNYAHVLVCLTEKPQPTTREIALQIGITERSVQRIVFKLVTAGVVRIKKDGRRNCYELDLAQRLRHPLESHNTVGEFLRMINPEYKALE
jgi:Mn-dependent DtxR family transcriptional regulator